MPEGVNPFCERGIEVGELWIQYLGLEIGIVAGAVFALMVDFTARWLVSKPKRRVRLRHI